MDEFSDIEESSNVGKIIGMVLLLLIILGAIGYYVYNKFYVNDEIIDDSEQVTSNKIDDEKEDIYFIDYTSYEINFTDESNGDVITKKIDIKYPLFNYKSDDVNKINDEIRDLVKVLNKYYQDLDITSEGMYNLSLNGVSTYFDEYCYYEFITGSHGDVLSIGIKSYAVSGDKVISSIVGSYNVDIKKGTKVDNQLLCDILYFNSENIVKDMNDKYKVNSTLDDFNIFIENDLVNVTYTDTNSNTKYLAYTIDGELTESIVKNN